MDCSTRVSGGRERRQSGKAKNEIGKLDTKGVNDERILLLGTSWKQE